MLGATAADPVPNNARLMDAATARRSPSTRCPYTSFVIVMLACPKISDTTCSGVPKHQRGARVPQLVRVPAAKPGPVAELGEGAREVLRVERCPGAGAHV